MLGAPTKPAGMEETAAWLRRRFCLGKLREKQADVVARLLSGKRVLFVAPTGHGKSLCYQALAASPWSTGVVLVFQPLKALMQEQVERARQVGLRAELVNSDQDEDVQRAVLNDAVDGQLDVLFLSPERQGNRMWLDSVGQMEIKGLVIDEAHCISQWGHDFRPWYRRLVESVMGLGVRTPVLAVTATAPMDVVQDVVGQIGPHDEGVAVERLGSHRQNLTLLCLQVEGFATRLAALLHLARIERGAPGIAYLLTQDETEMAAGFLRASGVGAQAYHAGMPAERRAEVLHSWRQGITSLICATSALGMGLDRADVRWIAHVGMPDSLLRYVQEIGRAGRDGAPAHAIAVHDPETRSTYEAFLHGSSPPPADFEAVANAIRNGHTTRTAIVLDSDIPDGVVQHILEEFVRRAWCLQEHDGSRNTYTWTGGSISGVPDGLEDAISVRKSFLEGALGYVSATECRAVALARAMGDDQLPGACGRCDVCSPLRPEALDTLAAQAREYLAQHCPPIPRRQGRHEAGLALSRYGLGRIGEAVRGAKYHGAPAPGDLVDIALGHLQDPSGPFAGVVFDVVASIPSATSNLVVDFAGSLAARLGVPWVELTKTRVTEQQKRFRSRARKERNIDGAFAVPGGVTFRCALLVDDVLDSGASLRAASHALRPATVYPLTLARAKHRDDL